MSMEALNFVTDHGLKKEWNGTDSRNGINAFDDGSDGFVAGRLENRLRALFLAENNWTMIALALRSSRR